MDKLVVTRHSFSSRTPYLACANHHGVRTYRFVVGPRSLGNIIPGTLIRCQQLEQHTTPSGAVRIVFGRKCKDRLDTTINNQQYFIFPNRVVLNCIDKIMPCATTNPAHPLTKQMLTSMYNTTCIGFIQQAEWATTIHNPFAFVRTQPTTCWALSAHRKIGTSVSLNPLLSFACPLAVCSMHKRGTTFLWLLACLCPRAMQSLSLHNGPFSSSTHQTCHQNVPAKLRDSSSESG